MCRNAASVLTLVICLGCGLPARGQVTKGAPETDQLRRQLDQALDEYRETVTEALQSVHEALDKQFEQAQKKGDFIKAKAFKDAKDSLGQRGELPKIIAVRSERSKAEQAIARAQAGLVRAYEDVRMEYTKNRNFEKAEAVDKELKGLRARFLEQPKAVVRTMVVAEVFLSDLPEQNVKALDWPQKNTYFGKNGRWGNGDPIRVRSQPSPKGILLVPTSNDRSEVTYDVPDGSRKFVTYCGINDGCDAVTPLTFKVIDETGAVRWASEPMTKHGSAVQCDVILDTARKITLVVECPGACNCAHAVWLEPRFVR